MLLVSTTEYICMKNCDFTYFVLIQCSSGGVRSFSLFSGHTWVVSAERWQTLLVAGEISIHAEPHRKDLSDDLSPTTATSTPDHHAWARLHDSCRDGFKENHRSETEIMCCRAVTTLFFCNWCCNYWVTFVTQTLRIVVVLDLNRKPQVQSELG